MQTSLQAYQDVAPFLDLVASQLGKNRSTLSIFDPYFCAGSMKKLLGSIGFHTVYNECEDFYSLIHEGRVPPHDVLMAGPPYVEYHVQRLLRFSYVNKKPYLIIMADHFAEMFWYRRESVLQLPNVCDAAQAVASAPVEATKARNRRKAGKHAAAVASRQSDNTLAAHHQQRTPEMSNWRTEGPVYLWPKEIYGFWVPKGMHGREFNESHDYGLGHYSVPQMPSIWYIDLEPVFTRQDFIKIARLLVAVDDVAAPRVRLCTSKDIFQKVQRWEGRRVVAPSVWNVTRVEGLLRPSQ